MLNVLDQSWKEHLARMDYMRQGIHLRGYAQKNPKQEYKREAFELFTTMLEEVKNEVTKILLTVQIKNEQQVEAVTETLRAPENVEYHHTSYEALEEDKPDDQRREQPKVKPFVRHDNKVGRNDPCPCGSGKKYKQCHGKIK